MLRETLSGVKPSEEEFDPQNSKDDRSKCDQLQPEGSHGAFSKVPQKDSAGPRVLGKDVSPYGDMMKDEEMSHLDLQKLRELRRKERELRDRVDMAVSGMDRLSALKQPQRHQAGGIDGRNKGKSRRKRGVSTKDQQQRVILPSVELSIRDLSKLLSLPMQTIGQHMRRMGEDLPSDPDSSCLDVDTVELICLDMGIKVIRAKAEKEWDVERKGGLGLADLTYLPLRPPIVTVMGHVDHGKTTLLDALRGGNSAESEVRGITQKLGSFVVPMEGRSTPVTFFDTPGHAAFTGLRTNTSKLTDIVVIAISIDSGPQSQTLEVLRLLSENPQLQAVVALTKIDTRSTDEVENARKTICESLLSLGLITEDHGGDVPVVLVSSKTKEGLETLLETLVLQAELMELHADPNALGEAIVIDSSISRGKGIEADVLITWGSLMPRQYCVVGTQAGRIRALTGCDGKQIKNAGVGHPVRVQGLREAPKVGEELIVVQNEVKAKLVAERRKRIAELKLIEKRDEEMRAKVVTEERPANFSPRTTRRYYNNVQHSAVVMKNSEPKEEEEKPQGPLVHHAIFKADCNGTLDAMKEVVSDIPSDEIELKLMHSGIGSITMNDIDTALAVEDGVASVYAFGVGFDSKSVDMYARRKGVIVRTHKIIYNFFDNIVESLSRSLPRIEKCIVGGRAEVVQVFKAHTKGGGSTKVAGCRVVEGELKQGTPFRVLRNGEEIYTVPSAESLRHFNQKVSTVAKGQECGICLDGFHDWDVGDVLENVSFVEEDRSVLDPHSQRKL